MNFLLDQAGIEVTPRNQKEVDRAFHEIMGVGYKDCPAAWRRLKQEIMGDEGKRQALVRKLREAVR